jgi:pyrimidine operon attenuation protein/uracil phosphoribosyltransferase
LKKCGQRWIRTTEDERQQIYSLPHLATLVTPSLDFQNQCILLIDDVILTGRTIRAAIEAILQIGRPKQIKTMVLINRNLDRETPISIDYEGLRINLNSKTRIKLIELQEHNLQLILENE